VSHDVKLERLFEASPEVVFGGFTALQAQRSSMPMRRAGLWGPSATCGRGVGGRPGFGPPRTPPVRETNVFQVVDWPRRLVYRSMMTMPDGSSGDMGMEVTFREHDGRTRVTIVQGGFLVAGVPDEFPGGTASILGGLGRAAAARVTDRS
jgi:hypothetical protein